MMKVVQFSMFGFDLISPYGATYYIIGFHKDPAGTISSDALELKGATLEVGDSIACIYGQKSSAGFEMLYPVAPLRFSYQGMFSAMDGSKYVLWSPEMHGEVQNLPPYKEYKHLYYAHAYLPSEKSLLFTITSNSGRVIESDEVYLRHEDIPDYIKAATDTDFDMVEEECCA